jgi:threonine/homoserine/homoserine lactone efflux protein
MIYLIFESEKSMLAYLISGATYGFAAAVSPGPLSMFLMSQAVSKGWKKALPIAFSPLITDGPVAVLVLAILSQVPSSLVLYLRILGGLLLLYLAYESWKSWRTFNPEAETSTGIGPNSLMRAMLINWLNPNPYIGWSLILGPMVLSGWNKSPASGVAVLLGFYATIVSVMIGMIFLFAAAKSLGPKVRRSLIGLSFIALACLGIYQLWLGISILVAAL